MSGRVYVRAHDVTLNIFNIKPMTVLISHNIWKNNRDLSLPVVPRKAVAEVQNRKPTGEVGCCEARMAERIH